MINEMREFVLELVQSEYETGHILAEDRNEFNELCRDEGYRATKAMYDLYEECHNLGPAGFYAEYKDELDFDPMFAEEYGHEEDENDDGYETAERYYVYGVRGNVESDDFEYEDDAIEWAKENNHPTVKIHRYFYDESGKIRPDGSPEVIWTNDQLEEALSNKEKLKRAYPELDFDTPVTETLTEAIDAEDKMQTAVGILYDMDNFVLSVYDNGYWLSMGVPDGEFSEDDRDLAEMNYADHMWMIEDDGFDTEAFKDLLDAFETATRGRDYDQNERARIIHEAEVILNMTESIEDMDRRCEECNTLLNDMGKCPKCDDGEEDIDESILTEASPADTIRSFDGYKGYKLEGNKLLRIRRGRNGLRRDYTGKSFDDASDAVAYVNNLPKVAEDLEEEGILEETMLTEADPQTKIQRNRERANKKELRNSNKLKVQADKVVQNDKAHKDAKTWTFYTLDKNGKITKKYSQVEFMRKFHDDDKARYNALVVDAGGNIVRRGTEWLYKKGYKFYPEDTQTNIPLEKYTYEGVYDLPPFFNRKDNVMRRTAVGSTGKKKGDELKKGSGFDLPPSPQPEPPEGITPPGGKDSGKDSGNGSNGSGKSGGSNGSSGGAGGGSNNNNNNSNNISISNNVSGGGRGGSSGGSGGGRGGHGGSSNNKDEKPVDDETPKSNLPPDIKAAINAAKVFDHDITAMRSGTLVPLSDDELRKIKSIAPDAKIFATNREDKKNIPLLDLAKKAAKSNLLEKFDDNFEYDDFDITELDEGLSTDEFQELIQLADGIGIKTIGELNDFKERESIDDGALLDYMRQYTDDIGPDFEIKEALFAEAPITEEFTSYSNIRDQFDANKINYAQREAFEEMLIKGCNALSIDPELATIYEDFDREFDPIYFADESKELRYNVLKIKVFDLDVIRIEFKGTIYIVFKSKADADIYMNYAH